MYDKIFTDEMAREILERYYPVQTITRKLVKTIHRAGHNYQQIDCIIYSLIGSPAKGTLMISVFDYKIKTIRVFNWYGGIISTISKYFDYKIED